ncbi:MAG: SH3 domain-containing protein [Pseudomonadota bacterium]
MRNKEFNLAVVVGLLAIFHTGAWAETAAPAIVTIEQAYVDLHTGPGAGYPVYTVVERGGRVVVLAEQGDWYKVQSERRQVGWLANTALAQARVSATPRVTFAAAEQVYHASRSYVLGVTSGKFGRDLMYGLSGSYHIVKGLHIDTSLAQSAGMYSMSNYYSAGLQWYLWSERRFSPGVFVMGGKLSGVQHATIYPVREVQADFVSTGLSMRVRLTDRFFLRTGAGMFSLQQFDNTLPNFWEWQIGVQTYL